MSDYSDLLLLLGAMVAFSLLSVTTAVTFQSNSDIVYNSEVEYRAVALAQGIIDEMRWFTDEDLFKSSNTQYYFKNYPETRTISYGSGGNQYTADYIVSGTSRLIASTADVNKYEVLINVKNTSTSKDVSATLQFIKSFKR
ncbi:hypothetical protein [Balneola vulgaris]|uniref:hypothetical protein n=1 Tax=Balneola vulgaris TaxID=287535 RepID=UPI0003630008|nr:hypothetical protein [Balneola vulgaris]